MESSIAVFLLRQLACELLPTSVGTVSKFAFVTACVKTKRAVLHVCCEAEVIAFRSELLSHHCK